MRIGKIDIVWNLGATLLRVASGVLLLPLVLRLLSTEDVGLWTVFTTVGSFAFLLDFGFNTAFARNVTYVFSGVKDLRSEGHEIVSANTEINYSLLKGLLVVMRRYYLIMALVLLALLLTGGSFYLWTILKNYNGNYSYAITSWLLYVLLSVYQLYTLYYDALMQGRGLIKRLKQIIVLSQVIEIIVTVGSLLAGLGIFSLVIGKTLSVFINRYLSSKVFFDEALIQTLNKKSIHSPKELFYIISPNALKIGVTTLGQFLVQKSAFFMGSLFLSLSELGSYGITIQVISVLAAVSNIYITTYFPKIMYYRVSNDKESIKRVYINGVLAIIAFYIIGSLVLVLFGNSMLGVIKSNTYFSSRPIMIIALVLSFMETLLSMSGAILSTKNEVPFFKASILSGIAVFILMFLSFKLTHLGLYGMVSVPLIVSLLYQGWKWPLEVGREFNIKVSDLLNTITGLYSRTIVIANPQSRRN